MAQRGLHLEGRERLANAVRDDYPGAHEANQREDGMTGRGLDRSRLPDHPSRGGKTAKQADRACRQGREAAERKQCAAKGDAFGGILLKPQIAGNAAGHDGDESKARGKQTKQQQQACAGGSAHRLGPA